MTDIHQNLWCEKYRPKRVADTILPKDVKQTFQNFVDSGSVPHLILSGGPGMGKTTVARAMLDEMGIEYLFKNGSLEARNIDTLRVDIANFAQTVSLTGARKFVILDEADNLNPQSTQPALRGFMDQHADNCGFILTCNFPNKLIEPLHSRCASIKFAVPKNERQRLAGEVLSRVTGILKQESVRFETKIVAALIVKFFPDIRRLLNALQKYSAQCGGEINDGILVTTDTDLSTVVRHMRDKNFSAVRRWIGENDDVDQADIFRALYDEASKIVTPSSVPALILTLGKYQYQGAFSVDPQINLAACMAEIMVMCEFVS